MAVQFIFGDAGSGKSEDMYGRIIRQSIDEPDRQFFVIVPEQFTMETQKKLCTLHPRGGIMNIDVQSFARLAHRIFEELGVPDKMFLDDEGKNLILRKIALQHEKELRVLGGKLAKTGYISEIKSVISEMMQYGVTPADVQNTAEQTADRMLSGKLSDIALLYGAFLDYIYETYTVKEELLDRLRRHVKRSNLLQGSVAAFYGFTGFTPVQLRLLGEMMDVCQTMYVTVDVPEKADPFTYRFPYELFAMSKKMTGDLADLAKGRGVPLLPSVYVQKEEKAGREDLEFLTENLFRYTKRKYRGKPSRLHVELCANPALEARCAVLALRQFMRSHPDAFYRQTAIVCTDMGVYTDALERAFLAYDIPYFMDNKKSILENGFVEYIRALLKMADEGFSYESVFRFLRAGFFPMERDDIDRLENYVLATGVRGYSRWKTQWEQKGNWISEEELARVNECRERFCERLDSIAGILSEKTKTVAHVVEGLYDFITREKLQERLALLAKQFEREGELSCAREYEQVGRVTLEVMEKLHELAGDSRISVSDFAELLDAGLAEAKIGVIPPGLDQVVVGDLQRTRVSDVRLLILLGANDTLLPGSLKNEGILSETDRQKIQEQMTLSPWAGEKIFIQKFYIYLAFSKPTDELYVFHSMQNRSGKNIRPSYLIGDIRNLFPELTVGQDSFDGDLSGDGPLYILADRLRERGEGLDDTFNEIYDYYYFDKEKSDRLYPVLEGAFDKRGKSALSKEAAQKLYEGRVLSASRLEHFAKCAYEHFLTYGLRLGERKMYEFAALDWGNMAHRCMELFSRAAQEEGKDWWDLTDRQTDSMLDLAISRGVEDYAQTILFDSARNEYILTMMKRLLRRSIWALSKQLRAGDFRPEAYELSFGSGKIDRVDVSLKEDKVYVRVIDYKTGNVGFDIVTFYHGLQLQLPVYLQAAVSWAKKKWEGRQIVPAGLFYYKMKDPIVERDTPEKKERNILRELRLDGAQSMAEDVQSSMEKEQGGRSSDFFTASEAVDTHFDEIMEYAQKIKRDMEKKMMEGNIDIHPYSYEKKNRTACDYCPYGGICGFEPGVSSMEFKEVGGKDPDTLLAEMVRIVEESKKAK